MIIIDPYVFIGGIEKVSSWKIYRKICLMISKYKVLLILIIFPSVVHAMDSSHAAAAAASSSSSAASAPAAVLEIDRKGSYPCDKEQCDFKSGGISSWQSHRMQAHGMSGGYCYKRDQGCGGWKHCGDTVGLLKHLMSEHGLKQQAQEQAAPVKSESIRSSSRKRQRAYSSQSSSESESESEYVDDESSVQKSTHNVDQYLSCDALHCPSILKGARSWLRHREKRHAREVDGCYLGNCRGASYQTSKKLIDHLQEIHSYPLVRTREEYDANVAKRPGGRFGRSSLVAAATTVCRPSSPKNQASSMITSDSDDEKEYKFNRQVRPNLHNNSSAIAGAFSLQVQQPAINHMPLSQGQSSSAPIVQSAAAQVQLPENQRRQEQGNVVLPPNSSPFPVGYGGQVSSYGLNNQNLQQLILQQAANSDREVQILTLRSVNSAPMPPVAPPRSYSPFLRDISAHLIVQRVMLEKQGQELQKIREQQQAMINGFSLTQEQCNAMLFSSVQAFVAAQNSTGSLQQARTSAAQSNNQNFATSHPLIPPPVTSAAAASSAAGGAVHTQVKQSPFLASPQRINGPAHIQPLTAASTIGYAQSLSLTRAEPSPFRSFESPQPQQLTLSRDSSASSDHSLGSIGLDLNDFRMPNVSLRSGSTSPSSE